MEFIIAEKMVNPPFIAAVVIPPRNPRLNFLTRHNTVLFLMLRSAAQFALITRSSNSQMKILGTVMLAVLMQEIYEHR